MPFRNSLPFAAVPNGADQRVRRPLATAMIGTVRPLLAASQTDFWTRER